MQIIHVTYQFGNAENTHPKRIKEALDTWPKYSDPKVYTPCHLTETDVKTNSKSIGDPYPHVIVKELIAIALRKINKQPATIFFTNADIRLKIKGWKTLIERAFIGYPNWEQSDDTRTPKPGEHQWQPHAYYIPQKWWNANETYIPPVLFPCPFWEPHLDFPMIKWFNEFEFLSSATEHEPHHRYSNIDQLSINGRKYNEAIQVGWEVAKFHAPAGWRSINTKSHINPHSYVPKVKY